MLTRKQQELLLFIHHRLGRGGVSPSFDEMKEALHLRSKSGIHRLITGLEERGFIRRLPHRARALEVVRLPEGLVAAAPPEAVAGLMAPRALPGNVTPLPNRGRREGNSGGPMGEVVSLPLYGRIAAGQPIEALNDPGAAVDVPASFLSGGDHYALLVAGDSMVEAGIHDGDTVIIRQSDTAENGAIVVALVDEREVTLKRLRRRGNTIALEAANPAYKAQLFGADRVKIQGRLVGLIRRY